MKRLINRTVIGVASLSLGYAMYPIINDHNKQENSYPITMKNKVNGIELKEITIPNTLSPESQKESILSQKNKEQEIDSQSITASNNKIDKSNIVSSELSIFTINDSNDSNDCKSPANSTFIWLA